MRLSKTDFKIMKVLWDSVKPLSYDEIYKKDTTLNLNTIQSQLRKLLENNLVKVSEVHMKGKTLCRYYSCTISYSQLQALRIILESKEYNIEFNLDEFTEYINDKFETKKQR